MNIRVILIKIFILFTFELNVNGYGETLFEPQEIDLTYSNAEKILYVRLCDWSVTTEDGYDISMKRYCYCTDISLDSSCSVPGPTLKMKENTVINVTIVNQLTGSDIVYGSNSTYLNSYKDMDTTNLHTHGLHVSPLVDDVLLIIRPGDSQNYPYNFSFHYPGTHWYHAHHHGSTTWQVNRGLYGTILMNADSTYPIDSYDYTVLSFDWLLPVPYTDCIDSSGSPLCKNEDTDDVNYVYENRYVLYDYSFVGVQASSSITSMCDLYCKFPYDQRLASGYRYDLTTNLPLTNVTYWFTNGQLAPVIQNIPVGYYHRLRMVNSLSTWYIQFKFPNECDWHLIATDGVYINSNNRAYNLSQSSHNNMLIQAPGQRIDVLVRCNQIGVYNIYITNSSSQDPDVADMPLASGNDTIFSINITNTVGPAGTNILPNNKTGSDYNKKPNGTYIENLFTNKVESELRDTCLCPVGTNCAIEFGGNSVNNKKFDYDPNSPFSDSLLLIEEDNPYTFIIDNGVGSHVYHQHINPFQVGTNIGHEGYIALPLTWWDTIGNYATSPADYIHMRFWTRNYKGLIILHCHILQHEDLGMMGFYNILNTTYYESISSSGECPADVEETDTTEVPDIFVITTTTLTDKGYMYYLSPINVIIFGFFIWFIC